MLQFNIPAILKARGIKHHTKFLTELGFSNATAIHYWQGKTASLSLKNIEILCEGLNCTPNDLLEFTPSTKQQKQMPNHPLASLYRGNKTEELVQLLHTLPYDKLHQIAAIVKGL